MSLPPQLIRVKRKRVEESPVTYLQLDESAKRHRSGSNWVYQRRDPAAQPAPDPARPTNPIIHVSGPDGESPKGKKHNGGLDAAQGVASRPFATAKSPLSPSKKKSSEKLLEPRRFHVSRAMLAAAAATGQQSTTGPPRKNRYGPTLFVERSRKRMESKSRQSLAAREGQATPEIQSAEESQVASDVSDAPEEKVQKRPLKKPGVANKPRVPSNSQEPQQDLPTRAPLPPSLTNRDDDMDKITADMNQWVLDEIGANLHNMEEERKQAERAKFRPKAPARRYQDRHPQPALSAHVDRPADASMTDVSDEDEDGDDWVIEEYVRVPANFMMLDVAPADVGVLVLDGEEENMLFYGAANDEDDEFAEDDEDENAENHYTADYPEDEVDSDDEYNRDAYMYRNGNASDDEEFDNENYEDRDSDELVLDADDDDDARMARIREYMRRNTAT